jgi:hypothetical protein
VPLPKTSSANERALNDSGGGAARCSASYALNPSTTAEGREDKRLDFAPRELLVIDVPEQPSERKPFLVPAAPNGNRAKGLGFTWPIRSGDATVAPAIETVHAVLRAGEAAMRRGPG